MGSYEGTSAWLRSQSGIKNEIVYRDIALSSKREGRRIEKAKSTTGNQNSRIPPVWDSLGKRISRGNIIESGKFLEIWLSVEPFGVGGTDGGGGLATTNKPKEDNDSMNRRINNRARKQIRRIVNANNFQAMHTLTLAPPSDENDKKYETTSIEKQRDYEYVRRLFKIFVQKLKRKIGRKDVPYIVVFEHHDSEKTSDLKRYTWHIHLCTHVDNEITKSICSTWKYGRVDTQDFRYDKKGGRRAVDICNPGAYIAEYIGKDGAQFGEKELANKKRYTTSRSNSRSIKRSIEGANITGNLDIIEHNGKKYKNTFYSCMTIPGTNLSSHNAHYMEVSS